MSRDRAAGSRRQEGHLALSQPALWVTALVAFASILFSVTFRLIDSDFWQHLLVGRVIWERHEIPREHLWSWLAYGRPEVLPSWLFRAALWPFYEAGGIEGLFIWRWLTTLLVFGFSWATARRMGARGFLPLVVMAWAALIYRGRSQIRPETLAAVLLAIEIWILESRRAGHRIPLLWLAPLTWIWANAHVSYFIAFVLLGVHVLAGSAASVGARAKKPSPPVHPGVRIGEALPVAGAMLALAFLNPFFAQGLWQPFDYALHLSKETLFQGIGELQPVGLRGNLRNGALLMLALWPALALWRWRQRGLDRVEALTLLLATLYALPSQRFLGVYVVACAPYLARDLEEWSRSRRWPGWTSSPWARATLAVLSIAAIGIPEWTRPVLVPGVGVDLRRFPIAAADFMAAHGVHGRGFGHFRFFGYQAWRFWPDRSRLPFMDIHQSGTPADRDAFAAAFTRPESWGALEQRYRLDYALLDRRQPSGAALLDVVDADTSMVLVFMDDTAALYVARHGALSAVADSFGFGLLAGGEARLGALSAAASRDSLVRRALVPELERALRQSPWNSTANAMLANLAMIENRSAEARARIEAALRVEPDLPGAHQRLGVIALWENQPRRAISEFESERRLQPGAPGLDLALGMAWEKAGDKERARSHYERELALDPGSAAARARLEALEGNPR